MPPVPTFREIWIFALRTSLRLGSAITSNKVIQSLPFELLEFLSPLMGGVAVPVSSSASSRQIIEPDAPAALWCVFLC